MYPSRTTERGYQLKGKTLCTLVPLSAYISPPGVDIPSPGCGPLLRLNGAPYELKTRHFAGESQRSWLPRTRRSPARAAFSGFHPQNWAPSACYAAFNSSCPLTLGETIRFVPVWKRCWLGTLQLDPSREPTSEGNHGKPLNKENKVGQ